MPEKVENELESAVQSQIENIKRQKQVELTPWNFVTVSWMTGLLIQGAKKTLQQEDLYDLPIRNKSDSLKDVLEPFWKSLHKSKSITVASILLKKYGLLIFLNIFLQGLSVTCTLTIPDFLRDIILYLTPGFPRETLRVPNGYIMSLILVGLQIFATLFTLTSNQFGYILQLDFRTILLSSVYEKSLRLSQQASREFTEGQILNIVNVDIEKVSLTFMQLNQLVTAPFQVIVSIILIGNLIGYAVWGGAGTLFLILLFQMGVIGLIVKFQKGILQFGDQRLKLLREILYGIKIIKLRALEEFFLSRISSIRNNQLEYLKKYYFIQAYFVGMLQTAPIAMPIAAFLTLGAIKGSEAVNASVVFPALALFNGLLAPILVLPQALTSLTVAAVSWKRIINFLAAEEAIAVKSTIENIEDIEDAVTFQNCNFEWESADHMTQGEKDAKKQVTSKKVQDVESKEVAEFSTFKLIDITLNIKIGSKVAIVGNVGSGKSSLLSAIIGDMRKIEGELHLNGSVAYCAQQPWILTDTILGNIIFGSELDMPKLEKVLQACALKSDLELFPNGINTEIGEKGVNLSGGQKARVALARALYKDPEIFLLDDPISALDAHVGRHVFDYAIKEYLALKTVILVTHQLHLLPEMDLIFVLDKGRVAEYGSYRNLMEKKALLSTLMQNYNINEDNSDQKKTDGQIVNENTAITKKGTIIVDEERQNGSVGFEVYWDYFEKCGGWLYVITFSVAAIFSSTIQVLNNIWLKNWSDINLPGEKYSLKTYMLVYGLLGVVQFIFAVAINVVFLVGAYRASKLYHDVALSKLLSAPMGFFDSQPIGRILNRFSKDISSIDQNIWIILFLFVYSFANSGAALVFLSYVDLRMLFMIIPLIILYFTLLKYYQKSNIEFKRFEAVNKSPLYAHVSETLSGISTVKAFGVQEQFIIRQRKLIDVCNVPVFLRLMSSVWVNLRLELFSSSLTLGLCILGVMDDGDAALIGLALTYAISFARQLNLLLFTSSQLENEFNSVERLRYYSHNLPREAPLIQESDPDLKDWPSGGKIVFNDVSLSYPSRPDVLILKNLSFHIDAGEKIGVIGRTGSGKSTLMSAIFRLVELQSGTITIDGINIAELGLHTLRKSIQIIPQEPVLFSGTIRENLDVESKYTDAEVWDILERIRLKEYVSELAEKLSSTVLENGENLSVGQRQLICLGRAILTKPRILIMDEATASVDVEADTLIQQSIQTLFKETTVISIAHRLNTIADFDKILVLQDGEKVEFAAPHVLLSDPNSFYFKLAESTGTSNLAVLQSMAKDKFEREINQKQI